MADMPPEFYVPAFGALISTITILGGVIKFLYAAKEAINVKFQDSAIEGTRTTTLMTEALRDSTEAIAKLAGVKSAAAPRSH